MRLVLAALLLATTAGTTEAQIFGREARTRTPIAWTSMSAAWLTQQELCDPNSSACWNFRSALQWRASLEYPFGNGLSVGVTGTTSRMPLVYAGSVFTPNSCTNCEADANLSQILGTFRVGGGNGLHQILEANGGVTMFSNFRDASGNKLGDGKVSTDVTVGIGVGIGYSMGQRVQIGFVQDYGLIFHKQQQGSTGSNVVQQRSMRLGIRLGLGDK